MKKIIIISLIVLNLGFRLRAHCDPGDDISKTFYSVRPLFQSTSPEKDAFFRDSFIRHDQDQKNKAELVFFGGETNNEKELAKYFLPWGKPSILIASDGAENAADRDVNAIHLNIGHEDDVFESCVTFCPQQKVWGLGVRWRQWLSRTIEVHRLFKGFWVETSFPIMRVENTMGFCENIINPGDEVSPTRVANACEAFTQSSWNYGKISPTCLQKTGIGDVELKLGWEAAHDDICHFESYIGAVVPTGNRPKGCYVFEPIVGNNHHWGFMGGSLFAAKCYVNGDFSFSCLIEMNKRYLFEGDEIRTFDLVTKPWGRYMEVYANQEAAETAQTNVGSAVNGDRGSPGVNYFTKCVKVKPGYVTTVNSGYLVVYKALHAEFGYNFFARQKEEIRLTCNKGCNCVWCCESEGNSNSPALVSATEGGYTTKTRTIKDNFNGAGVDQVPDNYTAISICDFDVNSAQHPGVLSHTLYGSLGFSFDDWQYPLSFGLGGSYETGSNNANSDRWTTWGRLALAW